MSEPGSRIKRKEPEAACPFCSAPVSRPASLSLEVGPEAVLGGECTCGSVFVLDATGRQGGECLLSVLGIACDGDLQRALALRSGVDYELQGVGYNPRTHSLDPKQSGRRFGVPKLWFLRLLG